MDSKKNEDSPDWALQESGTHSKLAFGTRSQPAVRLPRAAAEASPARRCHRQGLPGVWVAEATGFRLCGVKALEVRPKKTFGSNPREVAFKALRIALGLEIKKLLGLRAVGRSLEVIWAHVTMTG